MNMFEEARALWGTVQLCGISQSDLAEKLGVSQSYVANKLRLLQYSIPMQQLILDRGLTERHARTLLRIKDDAVLKRAVERIAECRLSVAEAEEYVDGLLTEAEPKKGLAERSLAELDCAIEHALTKFRLVGISAEKTVKKRDGETSISILIHT